MMMINHHRYQHLNYHHQNRHHHPQNHYRHHSIIVDIIMPGPSTVGVRTRRFHNMAFIIVQVYRLALKIVKQD